MASTNEAKHAKDAVLVESKEVDSTTPIVKGYDFNQGIDYNKLLESFAVTGYQATHFGRAVDIVNQMLRWRLSDRPQTTEELEDEARLGAPKHADRSLVKCTKFLGYTSNLVSSGLREVIRYLCEHKMIDCIVTTAGGIEEDFIKCLEPTYVGEFASQGSALRKQGLNRIGNLFVPNKNYVAFEHWLTPILHEMLKEQQASGKPWTPSRIIHRLGKEINHPDSIYYWCYKNDIPVYCPAITDGSLGDMLFFFSMSHPGLTIDILEDLAAVNWKAMQSECTGAIILGSGIVKHHICNANLMRNGTDYVVYINTAQEFDGSDAGATPDEAVSWGKIRSDAKSIKVCGDATVLFPLLVAQTFAKAHEAEKTKPTH